MNTGSVFGLLGVIILVILSNSFKKSRSPKKPDDWDPMLRYEGYNPPPTIYLDKDGKRCC